MTDFSKILLASDYDRTMTGLDGSIPPVNLAAVEEFMALGGAFTIATGRSKPMFAHQLPKLQVNAPVILANGGAVWWPEEDRVDIRCPMPPGWKEALWEIRMRFPQLRLELQGLRAHSCFGRDPLRDAYLVRNGFQAEYPDWDAVDDVILNASFYAPFRSVSHVLFTETTPEDEAPFEALEQLVAAEYGDLFDAVRSMPRMIEVLPKGCGKGRTARWLADALGRPVLYCAGDAPNDLPMLQEADEAFIPASADPDLLGLGFTETTSCDEGTIAAVVALLKSRL